MCSITFAVVYERVMHDTNFCDLINFHVEPQKQLSARRFARITAQTSTIYMTRAKPDELGEFTHSDLERLKYPYTDLPTVVISNAFHFEQVYENL